MSQTIITQKIAVYLRQTAGLNSKYWEKGHCHAFAVCHGAMDVIGKSNWWEAVLAKIANWDEDPNKLQQKIKLPGGKEETLETIFKRVINYLVFHQGQAFPEVGDFLIEGLAQTSLLSETEQYFELMDDQNNLYKIQSREKFVSRFSEEKLVEILTVENVSNTIFLLHSHDHAIRLGYHDGVWILYDSNYSHLSPDTMCKKFLNKAELCAEIFTNLGHELAIEIASFEKDKIISLPDRKNLTQEEALSLLEGDIFPLIVKHAHEDLGNILIAIKNFPTGIEKLINVLAASNGEGSTGLSMIAYSAPTYLPHILEFAEETPKGAEKIARALSAQNSDGWTGLHMIACYVPACILPALRLVEKIPEGAAKIAEALSKKNSESWTGLHMIACSAPACLLPALKLAEKTPEGAAKVADALSAQNSEGVTALHMIAQLAPACLPHALALAAKAPQGAKKISQALNTPDNNGWTGLHIIARYAPDSLLHALTLLGDTPEGLANIAQALSATTNASKMTGLHMIAQYAPKQLSLVLQIVSKAPNGIEQILQALAKENKKGLTASAAVEKVLPSSTHLILSLVSTRQKDLATNVLTGMLSEIRRAPTQVDSKYHGLGKKKLFHFFEAYGETPLLKTISVQLSEELKARGIKPK